MSRTERLQMRLGEWILDDLALETRGHGLPPFCCVHHGIENRRLALTAMYTRTLEQAANLGLLPRETVLAVLDWLRTGKFPGVVTAP